ncbi:TonB-dependent receptor plug domain-containing protein [Flavobacterium sp. F-65]|uniref:TonB-dependent receptor plug domain-containing protein n=1 Tax=Flavobacterium pisciphilum TaxID=2893755 RepID=A0ABS8MR84_9FLAO|nr:TonB-dependent receptor plug domain-containing protein [Flavobacterium sp. F-65]MCC9071273.1 TonB-dependent receptor plug domain-containing protein [Flavobacterium sp. F-65]
MKTISLNKGLAALWYPFIFGFYLFCTPALARNTLFSNSQQQTQVSGIVTDGTNPLPGVSISVKNQRNTVVTDFDGKFTITVSPDANLIFTYIGFKNIEIPVARRLLINVQMEQDQTTLQEVKINAGYYSVRESERTGSIVKIKAGDFDKQPVNNPLAVMQGRMAGVNITQNTGVPGGGFNIQIRGLNSIRGDGNDPLYIVNGVPYSSQSLGDPTVSASAISGVTNPLNNLNVSDIESIEVLKDADATAI